MDFGDLVLLAASKVSILQMALVVIFFEQEDGEELSFTFKSWSIIHDSLTISSFGTTGSRYVFYRSLA